MSENRDLARSLLAAARRRANKFNRERELKQGKKGRDARVESDQGSEYQGPQLLNQSLEELIAQRGWREKMKDSDLFLKWSDVVGAEIADHVQPLTFTQGVLTLVAESTAWATQIRLIHEQLRLTLTKAGFDISEIIVKGPHAPSWRKGGWSVKGGRGPRDTYG
jgi:predicted nucleic acid-binding Zn ribbon protein